MSTHNRLWFEEEIDDNLRCVFGIKRILDTSKSEFQDIELVDSGPFGKVLILDGKLQSAEIDEFVYHELLVHPPMLHHPNPKKVFILGGGEGSTAREILKNKNLDKVIMCDIDEEVVNFCKKHLDANREAFSNKKLKLVINDARDELIKSKEKFDVIVSDLADPLECGPCFELYTKEFYRDVIKARLNPDGIFVTQAGSAGLLYANLMFSPVYKTLSQVFKYVVPYVVHIPSFCDSWGWVMASDRPFPTYSNQELDKIIKQHIDGELQFLDGQTLNSVFSLNKPIRNLLARETCILSQGMALSLHGKGSMKEDLSPVATANGSIKPNGFPPNGCNGVSSNGCSTNGVASNGIPSSNGHYSNGIHA